MGEPFVQVRNLAKTYDTPAGPLNVLRGVDLDLDKGDFVAFQWLGRTTPPGVSKRRTQPFLNVATLSAYCVRSGPGFPWLAGPGRPNCSAHGLPELPR